MVTASTIGAAQLVTFIQQMLPGLIDGQYQLSIDQHMEGSDKKPIADAPIEKHYTFAVLGDRFRLADPLGSVYATFPQNAASGEFDGVLPHVVFTAPTLPWSRSPLANPEDPPPAGQDADGDVPSWLAILLLDADDVAGFPGFSIAGADATIGDLLPVALNPNSTLGGKLSYLSGAEKLDVLDPGDTVDTPIRVLDLPLPLFRNLAPTLADLSLLAHVRRVSLVNKPTMAGISDIGVPTGDFSIVIGNRLPARDKTSVAHLVSLEGLEPLLPTDPPSSPAAGDAAAVVRLAVLNSWSFTSTGSTARFTNALLTLNGREAKGSDAPLTALGLPAATTNPAATAALRLGYVPLDHDLRDGGATVSWYRGPLTPVHVPDGRVTLPVASADQALILDPSTGMFDVSYSAAWTLGRLSAVQDKAFSVGLYQWKRKVMRQLIDHAEEAVLQGAFSAQAQIAPPADRLGALYAPLSPAESAPIAHALHRSLLLHLLQEDEDQ